MESIKGLAQESIKTIQYNELFQKLNIPSFGILDILEIIILIYFTYKIICLLQNTRAWIVLKGTAVIMCAYIVAYICSFNVIITIFKSSIGIVAIALTVLFQGELRKILENIGNKEFFHWNLRKKTLIKKNYLSDESIKEIVCGCKKMSEEKTGALIVIKRDTPLTEYQTTGISLECLISKQMLIQIFEHNTPLHDGAIIIEQNKISSATCYLPLSNNTEINKALGTRHRAAIGISEVSDCLVVVVSEETGGISTCRDGELRHGISLQELEEELEKFQEQEEVQLDVKTNIEHKIHSNKQQKILATIFAVVIWILLFNINDPVITKTVANIPVTITNENALTDLNKTYNIISGRTATITVRGRSSDVRKLSEKNIEAIADLNSLSITNSIMVQIINLDKDVTMVENNNAVTVQLEEITSTTLKIETKYSNEMPEDLYLGKIKAKPGILVISGAASLINQIDRVEVESNAASIYDGKTEVLTPIIYDKNGEPMENHRFNLSTSEIEIEFSVLETKMVPIDIDINYIKNGKGEITNATIEPKEIMIAADNTVLNNITKLSFPVDIDVSQSSDTSHMVKSIIPSDYVEEGVFIKDEAAVININFEYEEYETKKIHLNSKNITLKNKDEEMEYKLDEFVDLEIKALPSILKNLSIDTIKGTVDVKELSEKDEICDLILNRSFINENKYKIKINVKLKQ